MQVDQAGLDFIVKWEWAIPYLYNDPLNATVAVGMLVHKGVYHQQRGICALCDEWPRKSEPQLYLTAAKMDELLREKVLPYQATVNALTPGLNQPQSDAMIDLCYNIGQGGYERSPVRTAITQGWDISAALQTHIYDGNGQALDILRLRREDECRLFYSTPAEEEGLTQAQYDELKAAIGAVLGAVLDANDRITKQNAEILTQSWLLANDRKDEVKARIQFEATAAGVSLP